MSAERTYTEREERRSELEQAVSNYITAAKLNRDDYDEIRAAIIDIVFDGSKKQLLLA